MSFEKHCYTNGSIILQYYEIPNDFSPLVLLHAQGTDSHSFAEVSERLAKHFHIYAIDCYGHGGSLHDPSKYNIKDIGDAVIDFIRNIVKEKVCLLGHSSGGLISAYAAANSDLCSSLVLEDPPFFSSQGNRRKNTYNYVDLSSACHNFLAQTELSDFVMYYFANQYMWNFFPEKSRDRIRKKMISLAAKYRKKHPDRDLKVPLWPKAGLAAFTGMNDYDPRFGEAFYTDSFHCSIPHEELLGKIRCRTLFMKARTNIGADGLLMAALGEDDLKKVMELVPGCSLARFSCGHGIHIEKPKEFVAALLDMTR